MPPLKKPDHYRIQCRQLNREKDQARNNTDSTDNNNNNSGQTNSNSNKKISNKTNANKTNIQKGRRPRPVYPPCETYGKTSHSTEKCFRGANAANRPPPRNRRPEGQNQAQQRNAQGNSDRNVQVATPNHKLETPHLYSGAACDRPEATKIPELPPIPEVVSQQHSETSTNQFSLNINSHVSTT